MKEKTGFNNDISIIRNCPGGSNAVTILCMDDHGTFYRKYAPEGDVEKLWQQILWIEEHKDRLPLPHILRKERTKEYCYYDMEYISHSVGLFEYAHSMPVNRTWNIIQSVLQRAEGSMYHCCPIMANHATIHRYYMEKIHRNIEILKQSPLLKKLMSYDVLKINGREYANLSYYSQMMSEDNIQKVFSQDRYSEIHGDLTMENVICVRGEQGEEDFYLIDPNTGNIHNSATLDYAKLLQSIHGEYEFIKTAKDVNVNENEICFTYTHSTVYKELFKTLKKYFAETFDQHIIRSIYHHEIVHWLRLMPYKLQNEPARIPAFYGKLLVIMDEVMRMCYSGRNEIE